MTSNIQVFVRCRPLVKSELNNPVRVEAYPELHRIIVRDTGTDKSTVKTFTYDKVFGPEASQAEIYSEIVAPLVNEVIQGFNCTIFAYGQTGTGKTFTIEGDRSPNLSNRFDDPLAGIIPRSMKHLFTELSSQCLNHDIHVSFLELYNEELFDLLSKNEDLIKLRMYENSSQKGSVIVQGLEIATVKSMEEVYSILEKGCKKRRKAVTLLNKASSRSHTIFTVTVNSKESSTTLEKVKSGKLNLVDLAGSENIGRSGAISKRAREAGNINQSLLALGRVITSLCEKAAHIPYRESKLTRLLQDSLGGQTKTAVIATISPSAIHIDETLNTLEYALRAKSITNKPELNAQVTVNSLVQDYLKKICNLREAVYQVGKSGVYVPEEENLRNWQSLLEAKHEEKFILLKQVENFSKEHDGLSTTIIELQKRLVEKENEFQNAKLTNEELKEQLKKAKDEYKLHEVVLNTLQPMHDCLHERCHKTLEEIKMLELESSKQREAVDEVLEEQRKLRETCNEILLKRKSWDEKFSLDSKNLMKDIRKMDESVKSMITESSNQVNGLLNRFDSRKSDCKKLFQDVSGAINELETIISDFQKDIDVSLLEDKNIKLKATDDFEKEYSSSNTFSELESVDQIISYCESNLTSLSTAANEWKCEATAKMEIRQKVMKQHQDTMKNTFESTAENVKMILNKQKENMEEFNNIASESLNVESSNRKMMLDKFKAAEQAISSLDICCAEINENEVNKTNQVYSSLKNYLELGSEIVGQLSVCGESSAKIINEMHTEADSHVPVVFSEKWKDLKENENSAFSRYKNLTEELESLSKRNQNFYGIRDSVRRILEDIDKSNEQFKASKSVQMLADSIIQRGNSFVSRMYQTYMQVEDSLTEDKLNVETFVQSSNRLSKTTLSKMSEYNHLLKNDLLERFTQNDDEETMSRCGASFNQTDTIVSEKTLCFLNPASEQMLSLQARTPDIECSMCLKNTDEFLKEEGNMSVISCKEIWNDKTELPGSSKSFMSAYSMSPIRGPRRKDVMIARKNLQFPDAEKLTQEFLECVSEEES